MSLTRGRSGLGHGIFLDALGAAGSRVYAAESTRVEILLCAELG